MINRLLKLSFRITLGAVLALSLQCSNPGLEPKNNEQNSADDSLQPLTADANRAASRIIFKFRGNDRLKQVKGSVLGQEGVPALAPLLDQPGRYVIGPLKAGVYDVLIEAQHLPEEAGEDSYGVALRLSGVGVAGDQDTILNDVALNPYLKIKGQVQLFGSQPQAGIELSIPSTHLKAVTAADGSFAFDQMPEGHHSLRVKFPGFAAALFEERQFKVDQSLPTLTLLPEDRVLPVGLHYLGEPIAPLVSQKVTIFLQRPEGMNLIRWGFTSDLNQASWLPYQSSLDFDLSANQRVIYLQFAQDAKQLSTVYSLSIPLSE